MESRHFDDLTVAVARGASRRSLLRGLVGGTLGVVALDRVGRPAPVAARPVANGCGHAGRVCEGTGSGTCCGNEKLTCTANVSGRCSNLPGNTKCAAPLGAKCQGHCECEGADTECRKGVCQQCPRERLLNGVCQSPS